MVMVNRNPIRMVMDKILSVMLAHFTRKTTERILSITIVPVSSSAIIPVSRNAIGWVNRSTIFQCAGNDVGL